MNTFGEDLIQSLNEALAHPLAVATAALSAACASASHCGWALFSAVSVRALSSFAAASSPATGSFG